MYSQTILPDILRHEMTMGSSHECSSCGAKFLANSDRCPRCGSCNISSLLRTTEKRWKWDMGSFPVKVWVEDDLSFVTVKAGDFSQWPRK